MMEKNIINNDIYRPDAGECEDAYCGFCLEKMDVERNIYGDRSRYAGILGREGTKLYYDCFTCPNREENWHNQIKELQSKAKSTPSPSIEKILLGDIEEIRKIRKPTKEGFWL